MRSSKTSCFIIVFLLMATTLIRCKKEDFRKLPDATGNYFLTTAETPLLIKQIALRIEAQNKKENFLDEIIRNDGYALWNKSDILTPSTGVTIAYIPLALKDSRYITSYIVYRQEGNRSNLKLIRGTKYASYGFGKGFSAHSVALDLMYLNQHVFGDTLFELRDNRLLNLEKTRNSDSPYILRFATARIQSHPASSINTIQPYTDEVYEDPAISTLPALMAPCKRTISFDGCTGFVSDAGPKECKNVVVNHTPGGICALPPLGPTTGPGEGGSIGGTPSGGAGVGTSSLPGLNITMPPCPVGMSQQVCDEKMLPVIRYLGREASDLTFNDIQSPVDEPEEPLIENGIEVEDIIQESPPGGNSRIIARTEDRGNTEDLEHGTTGDATGISISEQSKDNQALFHGMEDLFWKCTILDFDLQDVGNLMIQKFKTNTNVDHKFQNEVLNRKVLQSNTTTNFLKRFGELLQTALTKANGNINDVETLPLSNRPRFTGTYNKFHGLQILVNDTEYTEVQLDNFQLYPGGEWAAEVTVFMHDHFGLDKNDAITYQRYHRGFADWWLLQHTRGYVPFKSQIVIRKRIIGRL